MGKNITEAVQEICLGMPETSEVISRGSPNFRVAGKTFAIFQINHHGDGRIALWLHSPAGAQEFYVEDNEACYFVPPYVGPSGWLGVTLDQGLDWQVISQRIFEAYTHVAPARLRVLQDQAVELEPPTESVDADVFDPFQKPEIAAIQAKISEFCLALPEVTPDQQFGTPCFRAGKKNFCTLHFYRGRLELSVWAGGEEQALRTADPRYRIPQYIGHRGWLNLDIHDRADIGEVEELILESYRHFALKRMLKQMDQTYYQPK